jgi:armadillo repeat-containing protein 1
MSAKAIVTKLRTLAADPANRPYIVKGDQGCLPGLVVFLEDTDQDVVFLALEVIYFLSLETTNRELMARGCLSLPLSLSLSHAQPFFI